MEVRAKGCLCLLIAVTEHGLHVGRPLGKAAHQKHLERRNKKTLVTNQVFVFFTRKQQLTAPN